LALSKLVILITVRHDLGHQIAEAWREAGAPGVTFVESYGLRRLKEASRNAEILPGLVSMFQLLRDTDQSSLMLLSVVEDDAAADRLLDVTERTIGDMNKPDSGIAFVIDVGRTIGIRYSDHG
jgi:nitrogen regulatory protein PII